MNDEAKKIIKDIINLNTVIQENLSNLLDTFEDTASVLDDNRLVRARRIQEYVQQLENECELLFQNNNLEELTVYSTDLVAIATKSLERLGKE